MRFRIEQGLDAPLDKAEAALLDPRFLEQLGQLPKLGRPELLNQRRDGHVVHRQVRFRFSGELSPAVTRVVDPAKLTWVEVSAHDCRTHRTAWEIRPDHYASRLQCSGTFQLTEAGAETRRLAEGDVRVRFPVVGGRVEQAIVSGLEEHAEAEAEALRRWLAAPGG